MPHLLWYLLISNLGADSSAPELLFTPSLRRPMRCFCALCLCLLQLVEIPSAASSVDVVDTVLWQFSALHSVFCALCLSIVG